MNQFNEHINPIYPTSRTNKNFVYKGKEYPIDFSLVKKYSNFFYINKSQFKLVHDIEIKPNNYELSEEVILMFIACCQNQPFDINDTNVFALHQLSIQYDVPVLNNLTSQCIIKNKKSLVFQSIIFKLQNRNAEVNFDLSQEEEIIATNFFDYINDDQLFSLPISVLYRIINNSRLKLNSMNPTNQNQYIEFLFKCLDKYKRPASILFLNLDLENERIDLLSEIFDRYSNIFDFNLINSKFLVKNTSFILSELNKLKIEYSNKLNEIESENQKQKKLLIDFNNSKNDVLNSNQSYEKRIQKLENDNQQKNIKLVELEEKLNQQSKILEKYTNLKVNKIQIVAESKTLKINKTIKLTTKIKPKLAFIDDVEWKIIQDVEGSVEVESMNKNSLTLKCLKKAQKVTVVAKALDGSNVTDSIEIPIGSIEGTIEINVQQDQTIKGTIKLVEKGSAILDKSKSKYILNTNCSQILGLNAYESGYKLDSLLKEVHFTKPKGKYYLHVLVVDNDGYTQELVSKSLSTNGGQVCCKYTGSVQSVELDAGRYKLEAWGAQGGSFSSTYYGGYGGYSTGIIDLQSKTTLYVVVGKSTDSTSGGYNGGGSGGIFTSNYTFTSYGGGGASHIGLRSGILTTFSNDYSSNLLIVASGGGGATGHNSNANYNLNSIGGCGGGCCGAVGKISDQSRAGKGATQSSGGKAGDNRQEQGTFGQGSNGGNVSGRKGGGGGSGFYGGGNGGNSGPGGGGSGYINTSKLEEASMYGFEVPTSSSTESKTYSTTNVSSDAISNHAKKGDGYVKITPI